MCFLTEVGFTHFTIGSLNGVLPGSWLAGLPAGDGGAAGAAQSGGPQVPHLHADEQDAGCARGGACCVRGAGALEVHIGSGGGQRVWAAWCGCVCHVPSITCWPVFVPSSLSTPSSQLFLNLHAYTYVRLDGATKPEQRQILAQRFNSDPRIFCFILSTRRWVLGGGAVGVWLWTCNVGGREGLSLPTRIFNSAAVYAPSLRCSGGVGMNLIGADTVIFYDSGQWKHGGIFICVAPAAWLQRQGPAAEACIATAGC